MKALYLENTFSLPSSRGQLAFSLQNPLPKTYYETPFAILTAFNPMNETTPPKKNRERNRALESELKRLGYRYAPSVGGLDGHTEESFVVYGITLDDAVALGRRFRQYSVFYNSSKRLSYVGCDDKQEIVGGNLL